MTWNKKEYIDDFNKRFESGELADSIFDFLDDYLPQFFNEEVDFSLELGIYNQSSQDFQINNVFKPNFKLYFYDTMYDRDSYSNVESVA